ncbi:MAG: hypothetical protein ABGX51_01675 [Gammaproteobacteria bacterium]
MKINQKGIGLIGILITAVVIAIGLLAVASMQGEFYSSSGNSKTRAEALVIAEHEMEILRNMIQKSDYTSLPAPTSPVDGTNTSYTVTTASDSGTHANTQLITITVSWSGGGNGQQVIIRSEIVFSNPANSVAISSYGDASSGSNSKGPNPNQNSSVSVEARVELFNSDSTVKTGFTLVTGETNLYTQDSTGDIYRDDGSNLTGALVIYCSGAGLSNFDVDLTNPINYDIITGELLNPPSVYLLAKRTDLDNASGDEAIELYTENYLNGTADGTCTLQHQYFGGVIITLKGTVYTVFDLDDIKVDFNKEDMLCVFNPYPNEVSIDEAPYACYVGGNCTSGPAGVTNNTDFNTCPNPAVADTSVGTGGFSGNVGLLNVDDDGGGKESVCYGEELAGTNTIFSTARKYKTINTGVEQGINELYDCQDYLIVGRKANQAQLAAECSTQMTNLGLNLNLPPKEVIRPLSGGVANTVVTTLNATYCSVPTPFAYIINGSISSATGTITVSDANGSCTVGGIYGTDYECTGYTTGSDVEVHAVTATQTGSCIVTGLSSGTTTGSCDPDIEMVAPPTYIITDAISGLNGNASVTVTDYLITNDCTPSSATTGTGYECSISTNETSIRIDGVKNSNSNAACTIIGLTGSPGDIVTIPSGSCTLSF